MSENLNQNLYSRFGLQINLEKVQDGFQAHLKNAILENLGPIVRPSMYKEPNDLYEIQRQTLRETCRQLFIDFNDYDNSEYGFQWFVEKEFYDEFSGTFEEYLFRLQVFLNITFIHEIITYEFNQFIIEIQKYFDDFPILGHKIKIYKTKAPQILPSTSKMDTLGVLDTEQFKSVLNDFEAGLKIFANAKTDSQLKDVVEDMHASCDEVVKIVLNDKNKSFKHAADKIEYKKLGLSGHQKEIVKAI